MQTPRFCGFDCRAGLAVLYFTAWRPLRTNWLIVGIYNVPPPSWRLSRWHPAAALIVNLNLPRGAQRARCPQDSRLEAGVTFQFHKAIELPYLTLAGIFPAVSSSSISLTNWLKLCDLRPLESKLCCSVASRSVHFAPSAVVAGVYATIRSLTLKHQPGSTLHTARINRPLKSETLEYKYSRRRCQVESWPSVAGPFKISDPTRLG